jgi:hypothetical protein
VIRPLPEGLHGVDLHGPNTADEWQVWRLVLRGVATLREIEEWWSMGDVLDANEALDVRDAIQELGRPRPHHGLPPGFPSI